MSEILAHLSKRVNRRSVESKIEELDREIDRVKILYGGGTVAEVQSLTFLTEKLENERLKQGLSRIGRRLDLESLVAQSRPDGSPKWCVADPRYPIGEHNGRIHTDGECVVAGKWLGRIRFGVKHPEVPLIPVGIPPIPTSVRAILAREELKYARIVGLLFQPEGWIEAKPDPALIVEWQCMGGEFFALAVWGQDRPGIMEFVD